MESAGPRESRIGVKPCNRPEQECGNEQADPERREYPEKALPQIASGVVAGCTPRDQVPADSEESVHCDRSQSGLPKYPLTPEQSQRDRMGKDDRQRKDQPQEIQAVAFCRKRLLNRRYADVRPLGDAPSVGRCGLGWLDHWRPNCGSRQLRPATVVSTRVLIAQCWPEEVSNFTSPRDMSTRNPFSTAWRAAEEPSGHRRRLADPFAFFHMSWHRLLTTGLHAIFELGRHHRLVTRRQVARVATSLARSPVPPSWLSKRGVRKPRRRESSQARMSVRTRFRREDLSFGVLSSSISYRSNSAI